MGYATLVLSFDLVHFRDLLKYDFTKYTAMDRIMQRSTQLIAKRHGFRLGENLREPLARAIGLRGNQHLEVLDATAGLGRDAFILASLGAQVTLLERVKEAYEMLAATLAEALETPELKPIVERMVLMHADSILKMAELSPQVILIDPMHPVRKKSALVKKNMRDLRSIVGPDTDSGDLIRAALQAAQRRVVVKWPRIAKLPNGIPDPSLQIFGKTVRYDVFIKAPV